jgi:hypothetical protein
MNSGNKTEYSFRKKERGSSTSHDSKQKQYLVLAISKILPTTWAKKWNFVTGR